MGVLDFDVHGAPAETAGGGEAGPRGRDARIDAQAIQLRANPQDVLGGAEVGPRRRPGKPRGARVARARRESRVGRLRLDVGFALTNFGAVVIGRGHSRAVIGVSLVAVTEQTFGHHPPALGVVKDTGVFLDAGVEDQRAHHVYRHVDEWRRTEHQAVGRRQALFDGLHTAFRLLWRRAAADHRPDLGVQVDLTLRAFLCSVHRAVIPDGPDEPVAVPGTLLDVGFQRLALRQRPGRFFRFTEPLGDFGVNRQAEPHLEGDEQTFAVVAQLEAVVPVRVQAAGQAVRAGALQVEFQRAAQMAEHRRLALVGIG